MAAPTPVSALLHSATMGTAGIFLLFKFYYSFAIINLFSFGSFTLLFGSIVAISQSNMKKIIALNLENKYEKQYRPKGVSPPGSAWDRLIEHFGLNRFQADPLINEFNNFFKRIGLVNGLRFLLHEGIFIE